MASRSLEKRVVVGKCPSEWLRKAAVALEPSAKVRDLGVEHGLSAEARPPHLALLAHALVDQLGYSGFNVGRRHPFALSPGLAVVHQ